MNAALVCAPKTLTASTQRDRIHAVARQASKEMARYVQVCDYCLLASFPSYFF